MADLDTAIVLLSDDGAIRAQLADPVDRQAL